MSAVTQLNKTSFDAAIAAPTPVLVDFWAPWCGPCKAMLPVVDEIAKDVAGKATVAKVNVDEESDLAARFNINAIPAFIIFKAGKPVETLVGAQRKDALKAKLLAHA